MISINVAALPHILGLSEEAVAERIAKGLLPLWDVNGVKKCLYSDLETYIEQALPPERQAKAKHRLAPFSKESLGRDDPTRGSRL